MLLAQNISLIRSNKTIYENINVSLVSGITQLQLSLGAVSGADTISKISPAPKF